MDGSEWYFYVLMSVIGGNVFYLGFGGLVHWWHYIKNRDKAEEWKLQPNKFLSKSQTKEAFLLGIFNMNLASILSGSLAYVIMEKAWTKMYFDLSEYGYGWAFLSLVLALLFLDGAAYYYHTLAHRPFLYKHFHKLHHRYSAPEFYTLSAVHPVEWVVQVIYTFAPVFIFPIHAGVYISVLVVAFMYGFWDHAGIKLSFKLPFHGSNQFHDDHHKYFHVNFGFLTPLFDILHNTARREGHQYREDTFTGGKGDVDIEELTGRAIGPLVNYTDLPKKVITK
jgi:lathosterol oxidase